jgi:phosphoglycolate phosphatase-like HAD superfamily hydrolase
MHICFLDIDGTLVLTGGAGQTAFAQTLAEDFGIEKIDGTVNYAGRSDRAIAMDLFSRHGIDPSPENWQRFCAGYIGRIDAALASHKGFVLPGVVELLTALATRGDVALGLLTGNVRVAAERKLTYYRLWSWFPFGGFGDDYVERCDIAAAALQAARLHLDYSAAPQSTNGRTRDDSKLIVIGDTLNDITCGRSIGAHCVAVPTGHTTADTLRSGQPDLLVETLEDSAPILALLDN